MVDLCSSVLLPLLFLIRFLGLAIILLTEVETLVMNAFRDSRAH